MAYGRRFDRYYWEQRELMFRQHPSRICHICLQPGATSADHVVTPRQAMAMGWSKERLNHSSNLLPAHSKCNSSRGQKSLDDPRTYRNRPTTSIDWTKPDALA